MSQSKKEQLEEMEDELRYEEVSNARIYIDKEYAVTTANKYQRECKGVYIDVYDVLKSFNVTNPAQQHAIKKMLAPGQRGVKDFKQDLQEAIDSLNRAIELVE